MIFYKICRFLKSNDSIIFKYLNRTIFKITPYIMTGFYFISPPKKNFLNKKEKREKKIVVSMTTIPSRIDRLWIVLETLCRQSVKPDKIVIWLDIDCFSNFIPRGRLKRMINYGVEVFTGVENLKPHKKYFYAFQKYPDDIVITFDDDVLYSYDTIKHLMDLHKLYPECICCKRGNVVEELSYLDPLERSCIIPTWSFMATGVGGVLYEPSRFVNSIFDIQSIVDSESINTDDLWLKVMELLSGLKTVRHSIMDNLMEIPDTQNSALWKINTNKGYKGGNVVALNLLLQKYKQRIDTIIYK